MNKNDIIRIEITDVNNMGHGVGRYDGIVVFVDRAVTGDVIDCRIIKVAKDYLVGRIEKTVVPSPYRTEDSCGNYRCGGCIFGHVSREYELELKRGFVVSAFRRQGMTPNILKVGTDGRREGYRNKAQVPVGDGKAGYYARHSHDIIECTDCLLSPPEFNKIINTVLSLNTKNRLSLRHICIKWGEKTGEIMLTLVSRLDVLPDEQLLAGKIVSAHPGIKSIVLNVNKADTNVILGEKSRPIFGEDEIRDILCGCEFAISSKSFYQVNRGVAEMLYNEAFSRVGKTDKLLDLYCGAGTIGISYAKNHPDTFVKGIEIVPEAIENAKKNANANGIGNIEFQVGDAGTADIGEFDTVIVDPPRKGLAEELREKLAAKKIAKIVYVSCNPETLARDARFFTENGYEIGDVAPFDMFPRTGSVECVTCFDLKNFDDIQFIRN